MEPEGDEPRPGSSAGGGRGKTEHEQETPAKPSMVDDPSFWMGVTLLGIVVFLGGIWDPSFGLVSSLWRTLAQVVVAGTGGGLAMLGFTMYERKSDLRRRLRQGMSEPPKPTRQKRLEEGRQRLGGSFSIYDPEDPDPEPDALVAPDPDGLPALPPGEETP